MKDQTPETTAHAAELARLEKLADLMDARFSIFGIRFGLDAVVGLIPGVGDALVAAPSAWMIWRAHQLGLPKSTLLKMGTNTGLDFVIGSVPIVGDLFDIGFKGNLRNVRLIHAALSERGPSHPAVPPVKPRP